MRCSKCGAENPDRAKFCVECASPFARRCSSCNAENPQTAKFCLECAKPLEGAGDKSPRVPDAGSPIQVNAGTPDSLDGERKTVTVLFADIKGSMDLIEDLDPEDAPRHRRSGTQADDGGCGALRRLRRATHGRPHLRAVRMLRLRTKTTRNVHCLRRCECRRRSGAMPRSCAPRRE